MSRALVLSGGGPVGIAWETGIVAGLAGEGVDLAAADLIVGTSAGSVVGAQIATGSDMGALAVRYRDQGLPGSGRSSEPRSADPEKMTKLMEAMAELFTSDAPPEERRAKIGAFALSATTAPEEAFVANIASMLGADDGTWPRRYACTAVDASTGAFVEWDEAKRVDLGRAVASSCAVPGIFPPITIGEGRYVDGGMRSVTNADLAKGHDHVVVISLIGGDRASMLGAHRRDHQPGGRTPRGSGRNGRGGGAGRGGGVGVGSQPDGPLDGSGGGRGRTAPGGCGRGWSPRTLGLSPQRVTTESRSSARPSSVPSLRQASSFWKNAIEPPP